MAYFARRRSGVGTLLGVAYILIGILVANSHGYFRGVEDLKDVISAVLAVVLWPLVLARVNLHLK